MADWTQVAAKIAAAGAPAIGGVLAGPAGGALGSLVGGLVGEALGVPATPESVGAAIDADPAGAAAKIGRVEAEHKTTLELAAQDIENARKQTVDLARAGSDIAWGAPVVSIVTTGGFVGVTSYAVFHGVADSQATQLLIGVLATGFSQVIGYWLGSSYGSRAKDQALAAAARR